MPGRLNVINLLFFQIIDFVMEEFGDMVWVDMYFSSIIFLKIKQFGIFSKGEDKTLINSKGLQNQNSFGALDDKTCLYIDSC